MHGTTHAERRRIRGRMGPRLYHRRIFLEETRELKLGGLVRLCPMRLLKPALTVAMKATGFSILIELAALLLATAVWGAAVVAID